MIVMWKGYGVITMLAVISAYACPVVALGAAVGIIFVERKQNKKDE